jgi:hypothetical protein
MVSLRSVRLSKTRLFVVGALILVMLAAAPLASAMESRSGESFSKDDSFGPVIGRFPLAYTLSAPKGAEGISVCDVVPLPVFGDPSIDDAPGLAAGREREQGPYVLPCISDVGDGG